MDEPPLPPVGCHCETSDRSHWLWQSVFLWICTRVLRIPTTSVRTGLGMTGCKECRDLGRCRHRPLRKRILWCVGEGLCPSRGRPQGSPLRSFIRSALRVDRGILPYGGFPDRTSRGLPTPFLHISCSLCVDSLWINFPSPFLPPSCGNPSFPLWTKNLCISRPYGGFPQKFSLRLLLLKNT